MSNVAWEIRQGLKVFIFSLCLFPFVADVAGAETSFGPEIQASELTHKIKTVIDAQLEPGSRNIDPSLLEVVGPEHRDALQQRIEQEVAELEGSLSLLRACESRKCQASDLEKEFLYVVQVIQVASDFLSKDRFIKQQARLFQAGHLLERILEQERIFTLNRGQQAQAVAALVRLSDRAPNEIVLKKLEMRINQLIVADSGEDSRGSVLASLTALYQASADTRWLLEAEKLADKILTRSKSLFPKGQAPTLALPLAGQMLLLFHFTGSEPYRDFTSRVVNEMLVYVTNLAPQTLLQTYTLQRNLQVQPFHMTVVGPKSDQKTALLFNLARAAPGAYRRIEWWDPSQGVLPNPDVRYPVLKRPAAFLCVEKRCSLPLFSEADVRQSLAKIFN